jgi:energy-coupling factor transport system ATP-binding protein
MLIDFKDVHYTYLQTGPAVKVLKDINLSIFPGDFLSLIGSSGAGKSTLLLHLNGLLKPTQGKILYKGTDIHTKGFKLKELRCKVGMLFQYPENNFFGQTVYEDISYAPRNLGKQGKDLERAVELALERVGVPKNYLSRSPFGLSGGEKRRVALAGVLAMDPELLVLDEPTAGLDPTHRHQFIKLMQELHKQGTTVVMVSHEMDQVSEIGGRTVVLAEGRIVAQGTTRQVMTKYDLCNWGLDLPEIVKLGRSLSLEHRGGPVLTEAEALEGILQQRGGKGAK